MNAMTNTEMSAVAINEVDMLGNLLARIAELTKQADAIKDGIKDSASMGGAKVVEGNLFKATYIESNRSSIDWLALVAAKIGYEEQDVPKAIAANTKTTAVFTVKVTSR